MFSISTSNAFGLDISDFVVRLVKIRKAGKKFIVINQNEVPMAPEAMVLGEIKRPDLISAAIKKLIDTASGKKMQTNLAITSLPEPKTFIKLLSVTAPSLEELPQNLVSEMEKHIPFAMDEIYFDWQLVGEFKANKPTNVLIGVAPTAIVDTFLAVIKNAGLVPLALEIESAAITRSLLPFKKTDANAKIIIDMGASRTGLIVYDRGTVQFTMSLPIAGNDITRKISEKLDIDPKKAEKAKIICGLDDEKCKGVLKTVLMENMVILTKKIEEAMNFYQEASAKNTITEIVLCGNGSNLISLDTFLQERFHLPVSHGNPLANIAKIDKAAKISKTNLLAYTTAIGLALRAFE